MVSRLSLIILTRNFLQETLVKTVLFDNRTHSRAASLHTSMLPITSKFANVLLSLHANAEIILTRVRAINMDIQLPHPQGRPLEMPRMVLAIKRKCETVSNNCIIPILESG